MKSFYKKHSFCKYILLFLLLGCSLSKENNSNINFIQNASKGTNSVIKIKDEIIESQYIGDRWASIQLDAKSNTIVKEFNLLLGNAKYPAISYSGYRGTTRKDVPSIKDIKEDLLVLSAMGIKLIRTYHSTGKYMENLVHAIDELNSDDPSFEMYIMLGAWIQCYGAYTSSIDHNREDFNFNKKEIEKTIEYAFNFSDIIKIIAVGNEAMVKWQEHWVDSKIILKWVQYLKAAKGKSVNGYLLPRETLITSSDNFATWGAEKKYRGKALTKLIKEVDFISLHTYPFHDTHYNNSFWNLSHEYNNLKNDDKIRIGMEEAFKYAVKQYNLVKQYIKSIGIVKPIHIGETGWSTMDNGFYSEKGSRAADELKMKIFYDAMRKWTNQNNISMFYFEAFNEPWKGGHSGSESHFGLFTVDGKAKYVMWDEVDSGIFNGLKRGNKNILKTYDGINKNLFDTIHPPPRMNQIQ